MNIDAMYMHCTHQLLYSEHLLHARKKRKEKMERTSTYFCVCSWPIQAMRLRWDQKYRYAHNTSASINGDVLVYRGDIYGNKNWIKIFVAKAHQMATLRVSSTNLSYSYRICVLLLSFGIYAHTHVYTYYYSFTCIHIGSAERTAHGMCLFVNVLFSMVIDEEKFGLFVCLFILLRCVHGSVV